MNPLGYRTEEGVVELLNGEAEARLGEAAVGEAAASAAGERADAVGAAAAADGDVLEVEGNRGADVAGGVVGRREGAGRHRTRM